MLKKIAFINVFSFLFFSFSAISCTANELNQKNSQKTDWRFVEMGELPLKSQFSSDAYSLDIIKISNNAHHENKFLVIEGWEEGWEYSLWTKNKWVSFTEKERLWLNDFIIGDFNFDNKADIILFENYDNHNFQGEVLPKSPRLFLAKSGTFQKVEVSCSPDLKALFLSKLKSFKYEYISENSSEFLTGLMKREEQILSNSCQQSQ